MSTDILPRATIGRFQIQKKLGEGAFGRVFLAEDPQPRDEQLRLVAVKLPHPHLFHDMTMQLRFLRELQTMSCLDQLEGVCQYLEQGLHQRTLFLVMQYISGESLEENLRRTATRSPRGVLQLIREIAWIMATVHERKIVHRDLKPSNVILREGPEIKPVILDFGLARGDRAQELKLTRTGQVLGSPHYMAPEVVNGNATDVEPAADIFSLGVMFFELLTGRRPFDGPLPLLLDAIAMQPAPPPSASSPGLPTALDALCLETLEKEPSKRFGGSMSNFAMAIDGLLERSNW